MTQGRHAQRRRTTAARALGVLTLSLGALLGALLGAAPATAAGTFTAVDGAADPTPGPGSDGDATYYVVAESWNGEPEFLYSIAERLLGTGERAMDIYALNEGRAQPGGAVVSDPNVIRPGWVLVLPPDAVGEGVQVGPLPTPAPRPAAPPAGARDEAEPSPSATPPPRAAADAAEPSADLPAAPVATYVSNGVAVLAAVSAGIATLVLVVGGVVVLVRRRRAGHEPPATPVVRRDDPGAWTVDRTTRALARACADAHRPVPTVHTLVLSDDEVRLRLTAPDARPPDGWSVTEDGLTWTSPMRPLQDVALDAHVLAPWSRLVTLGDDAQGRVLVDLTQAGPGLCLDGDPVQAVALAERWHQELATSPWSRHVPLVAVGTGPTAYERLDDAGAAVDAAGGGVLVVAGARARDADRLATLAAHPAWSVVVVGAAGRGWARWRLTVDHDGVVSGGPLDTDVHLHAAGRRLEPV